MVLIVLGGCATTDYFLEARACGNGDECTPLWEKWNKQEEKKLEKEQEKQARSLCSNQGLIMFCPRGRFEDRGSRCACVKRDQLPQIFN